MKTWSVILGLILIIAAATIGYFRKHPSQYVEVKQKLAEKMTDEKPAPVSQVDVAFVSDSDPRSIYLGDRSEYAPRLLYKATGPISRVKWSSDGRLVAFLARTESGTANGEVRVVDVDGGHFTAIAEGADFCWSPDARKLLYIYQPEKSSAPTQLKIIDRQTGATRILLDLTDKAAASELKASSLSSPGCSASSRYASVLLNGPAPSLCVIDIDKGMRTTLPANMAAWSPRKDELLAGEPSKGGGENGILAILSPALAPGIDAPSLILEEQTAVDSEVGSALWDSTGHSVYYVKPAARAPGEKPSSYDLFKYDRASGSRRAIKQGLSSAWMLIECAADEQRLLLERPAATAIPEVELYYSMDLASNTIEELRLRLSGAGKILEASWKP